MDNRIEVWVNRYIPMSQFIKKHLKFWFCWDSDNQNLTVNYKKFMCILNQIIYFCDYFLLMKIKRNTLQIQPECGGITWQIRARGSLYAPWQMGHRFPASMHWALVAAAPECWKTNTNVRKHFQTLAYRVWNMQRSLSLTPLARKTLKVFSKDVHWLYNPKSWKWTENGRF